MRISPINNVAKMKLSLLIFHDEQDGIIPEKDVARLEAALKKAGNNAEVNIIDNEGHSFGNNNITYVLEKSLRHFARCTTRDRQYITNHSFVWLSAPHNRGPTEECLRTSRQGSR